MAQKEKQAFLFHFKWFKRMEKLSASQKALLLDTMNLYSQNLDIKNNINKMPEKVSMIWDIIQEDMQDDIDLYNKKCLKNRQNASLGGLAKAHNRVANASECYQTLPNATVRCRSLPDIDIDTDSKEKIYKKESSECYNIDELIQSKFADADVANKFAEFLAMRAGLGKNKEVTTIETFNALIDKLRTIATNKTEALQVLNNSIINNLTDLYPPHKNNKTAEGGVEYAN